MMLEQKQGIRAISDCDYNCPQCNMRKGCFVWEREKLGVKCPRCRKPLTKNKIGERYFYGHIYSIRDFTGTGNICDYSHRIK